MLITSKSPYHANIVFVFDEKKYLPPDFNLLLGLYQGDKAKGMKFIDNPSSQTKILILPALKIKVILERGRLRVEDDSEAEPHDSPLIVEASKIYQQLFARYPLSGYGFNFDIYYRYSDVIRIKDIFNSLVELKATASADLRDMGFQFTLEKAGGKRQEQYFVKIVSPLEIAAHVNFHYSTSELPPSPLGKGLEAGLQTLFEANYNGTDEVMGNLKF